MTKTGRSDDPFRARVREKGDEYRPPDIKGVLHRHHYLRSIGD
jgi:hypothetical protein